MAWTVPIVQVTAVLGDVTRDARGDQRERPAHAAGRQTVRRHAHDRGRGGRPVAVHAKLPVLGAVEASVVYVLPPLRLSSIFTVAVDSRFDVHVIVCAVPIVQLAPAAGDVTDSDGLPIVNVPLVPTAGTLPFAVTRTTAALVAGPVAVHARLPVAGAADASVVQLAPPSRLSSTRTVVPAGRLLDQEIVRAVPIAQLAPAAGDVTASVAVTIGKAAPTPLADRTPCDVTRTRACAVSGPDAVQTKLPVFGDGGHSGAGTSRHHPGSIRSTRDRRREGCPSM